MHCFWLTSGHNLIALKSKESDQWTYLHTYSCYIMISFFLQRKCMRQNGAYSVDILLVHTNRVKLIDQGWLHCYCTFKPQTWIHFGQCFERDLKSLFGFWTWKFKEPTTRKQHRRVSNLPKWGKVVSNHGSERVLQGVDYHFAEERGIKFVLTWLECVTRGTRWMHSYPSYKTGIEKGYHVLGVVCVKRGTRWNLSYPSFMSLMGVYRTRAKEVKDKCLLTPLQM